MSHPAQLQKPGIDVNIAAKSQGNLSPVLQLIKQQQQGGRTSEVSKRQQQEGKPCL